MALIKCPECGRENVSDTAISCPDCGFNVRKYIDEKKKESAAVAEEDAVAWVGRRWNAPAVSMRFRERRSGDEEDVAGNRVGCGSSAKCAGISGGGSG